jgi:hypothetical protein
MNFPLNLSATGICAAIMLVACKPSDKLLVEESSVPEESEPVASLEPTALPANVTFNEHIQPILSEYCYHCHGPDAGTREPKDDPLRLDLPDGVYELRDSGSAAIVKGDPAASRIVQLMKETREDVIMPPPESHKTMKPHEIALIERWIEQGAEYQAHWSFAPVAKPAPPEKAGSWAKNPIDSFVFEKLAEAGLEPNPEESPARFLRRLSFDLTGLPPSPEAVLEFEKAAAVDYDKAVSAAAEQMMASVAHAEHMARHWLDAARYADTHGIHIDNYRSIWPYRDWVIQAFNSNMPWDQFTIEQIAGDMLPNRTLDQQVASGFNRCLATTGEGGAIAEEYDAIYAADRVDTTAAIWLGLTASCASCHDHKFDPLSIKEFYSLAAFFRNNTMNAMDGNNAEHAPVVFVPNKDDRSRWDEVGLELVQLEESLKQRRETARADFNAWLAAPVQNPATEIDHSLALHLPLDGPGEKLRGTVDGQPREWESILPEHAFPGGKGSLISGTPVELGDIASFTRGDQVTYGGFVMIEGAPTGAIIARMAPTQSFRGWDLYLAAGHAAAHVIDSWDQAATKITSNQPLKAGQWQHVMVTFNGKQAGHSTLAIYVDGEPQKASVAPNTVGGEIVTNVPLRLGSRDGDDSKLTGTVALRDFRFYRRLLNKDEISRLAASGAVDHILALPVSERSKEQEQLLFEHYMSKVDGPAMEIRKQLDQLKAEQEAIRKRGAPSLVMEEIQNQEAHAYVLNRGVYSDKGDRVTANTPAFLPPMAADLPKNRLGLAKWLNDPANPLPARVTMNRTWYYLFGTGIVETNGDFGIMGARPSHPQLLDWLASEFIASGWNYRQMLKTIVTSATYRQSGKVSPEKLEKDPKNRLLSRGPRYRLDAEQIRDLVLHVSGLLSHKTGGPPVRPYQPEGIWEAVAMPQSNTRHYKADTGEGLYRRSLYTIWKRTAPHASMEILNAPSREKFCVQREMTNTPLQAFVTLNDPQFVEASRALAEHLINASADMDERLDIASMRFISRQFDPSEREIIRNTLEAAAQAFREKPDDAKAFVSTGESKPSTEVDIAELAAWTLVCSQILNLDESLNK